MRRGLVLQSVQGPDSEVRVLYQDADLQVVAAEIQAGGTLIEPSLWGTPSWHVVTEGQAIYEQQDQQMELLREESIYVDAFPYRITNPAPETVKLFAILLKRIGPRARRGAGDKKGEAPTD